MPGGNAVKERAIAAKAGGDAVKGSGAANGRRALGRQRQNH